MNAISKFFVSVVFGCVVMTSSEGRAEMRTFLMSCAYGAGIGAIAGLTSLAFSESPGNNLGTIARGASIGLYVGMGVGYYLSTDGFGGRGTTRPALRMHDDDFSFLQSQPERELETKTVATQDGQITSMPVVALLPNPDLRGNRSADLFVGYRFAIP